MIAITIELAVSWLMLWLFHRTGLAALGLKPTGRRLGDFSFGFGLTGMCCGLYFLTITFLTGNYWEINPRFSFYQLLGSSWWTLRSVIYEELLFRGALLYTLIRKTNVRVACSLSAAAFGVYHWFSMGVLGDPVQMTYIFVSTGVWGLMFAFAFAKTGSLYMPLGLHFGWNLLSGVVFSQGPLGDQLLISTDNGRLLGLLPSMILQTFQLLMPPILVYFYLRRARAEAKTS